MNSLKYCNPLLKYFQCYYSFFFNKKEYYNDHIKNFKIKKKKKKVHLARWRGL